MLFSAHIIVGNELFIQENNVNLKSIELIVVK